MTPVKLHDVDGKILEVDYDSPNYESHTVAVVKRLVQPGDVCYDVGANIGYYTFLFAQLAGPQGLVYAFEPLWSLRQLHVKSQLRASAPAEWAQIRAWPVGLADTVESKTVVRGQDWELLDGDGDGCEEIWLDRLDRLLVSECTVMRPPTFMKIDIDGYESRMLRGARETLIKYRPYIVIELATQAHEHHGQDVRDAIKLLVELGYGLYHEDTGEALHPYGADGIVQQFVPRGGSINVVAQHASTPSRRWR